MVPPFFTAFDVVDGDEMLDVTTTSISITLRSYAHSIIRWWTEMEMMISDAP